MKRENVVYAHNLGQQYSVLKDVEAVIMSLVLWRDWTMGKQ